MREGELSGDQFTERARRHHCGQGRYRRRIYNLRSAPRALPGHRGAPLSELRSGRSCCAEGQTGDDAAADDLYQEAIGCSFDPWLSADAIVGQAAVARRLGDLARAKRLLDTAADRYREADAPAGHPRVLAGLAWWALGAQVRPTTRPASLRTPPELLA